MADPRREALRTLYPTKSYGVALRKFLLANNDGSWRERDLFTMTASDSYSEEAAAYWMLAAASSGDFLMTQGGDFLMTEGGDFLVT